MKGFRLHPLQILTHIGAWIPLAVLVVDFIYDNLTINPIQAAEQRTGNIALFLLVLSLACTPANTLLRLPVLNKLRRPLGLYGYMYAAIHLAIFAGLDYNLDPQLIWQAINEKLYLVVGIVGFAILSIVALTSFQWWMVRLGKNWKRLHKLVYIINLLVVLHFGLSVKGDFFRLHGDVLRPLLALAAVSLLLILRIPAVRRSIAGQRRKVTRTQKAEQIPPLTEPGNK